MKVEARLVQRHNDKTDRQEWALISKKSGKVLKWFGARKPSADAVQKEERRIQYFKHAHGDVEMIDPRFEEEDTRQDYRDALPFEGPWNGYDQKHPMEKTYPLVSKILAGQDDLETFIDKRYPDSGFRQSYTLPIDQTYGFGFGEGVAKEPNPFTLSDTKKPLDPNLPIVFNFKFEDPEDLRSILPQGYDMAGIDPYEKVWVSLNKDSVDISREPIKPGEKAEVFQFKGSDLQDSRQMPYHGKSMEEFTDLTDLLEWIVPIEERQSGHSSVHASMRAFAKATLPEGSELLEFYYMADAESWREQAKEEGEAEWERMDEEERREVILELIAHGYSSHFPHDPKTEDDWDEVKYAFLSNYEDQEQEYADTSTTFFEDARILTNPTLVRFSEHQTPDQVKRDGFPGYGPKNLGLTHHYRPSADGTLAFAVDKRDLKTAKDWQHFSSKYGEYAYEFKVPYAVKAHHNTDGEDQVIFDVETVKDLKVVDLDSKLKTKHPKIKPMKKGEKIPF